MQHFFGIISSKFFQLEWIQILLMSLETTMLSVQIEHYNV